jgi:ribosomal-protein-alanine N-acetyltransferase
MTLPTIVTGRLTLRAFTEKDAEPLYHLMNDEEVMRYFPSTTPPNLERVQRLVRMQIEHWDEHGHGWWAATLSSTGELIGWNGLQYLPETDEVEVGYLLGKAYWGRGLATEGAREGLRHGFETLNLDRIVGIVHPENLASRRVLEKLGMSLTGPARYFGMDCLHYWVEREA